MDKLNAMRFFCQIAESGSFSAAARKLKVPVSSLSRSLQALESELGAALLKRSTRHVAVTEIGHIYLEQCQAILQNVNRAESLVSDYQSTPSGILRISALPMYADVRLLPALERLQEAYPEIIVDLDLSNQVMDFQRDGFDIVFRGGGIPEDRVIAHYVDNNTPMLCAAPAYLEQHGTPKTVSDLRHHKAVFYRAPHKVMRWLYERDKEWSPVDIDTAIISNGGHIIRQALVSGKGMGLMPGWCMQKELERGELVLVPLQETLSTTVDPSIGIYLLYQHAQYAIPKIKVAVDLFRQQLQKVDAQFLG